MTSSSKLTDLFINRQVKFSHPITCLNPQEWTTITEAKIENNKLWVRGENTCWFNFIHSEIRNLPEVSTGADDVNI